MVMRVLRALAILVPSLALSACSDGDSGPTSVPEDNPKVVAMSPAPGHEYVASDQSFAVEFTESMNAPSVEAAYAVMGPSGPVEGHFDWNDGGTMMTFTPDGLLAGMEVEVRWGSGMRGHSGRMLRDAMGERMEGFSFGATIYPVQDTFASNGERIYFTATSESGEPISFDMGDGASGMLPGYGPFQAGMGGSMMGGGMGRGTMGSGSMHMEEGAIHGMSCVSCHGRDGSGGKYMAMGTVQTPSIQYAVLTGAAEEGDDHAEAEDDEHAHAPYTRETIGRAITEGLNPDGGELEWLMPRWKMKDEDLEALLSYVESL